MNIDAASLQKRLDALPDPVKNAVDSIAKGMGDEINREPLFGPPVNNSNVDEDLQMFVMEESDTFWWLVAYSEEHARALLLVHVLDDYGWDEGFQQSVMGAEFVALTEEEMEDDSMLSFMSEDGVVHPATPREYLQQNEDGACVFGCSEW